MRTLPQSNLIIEVFLTIGELIIFLWLENLITMEIEFGLF